MNIGKETRTWIRDQLNIRVQWLKENPCYLWAREKNKLRTPQGIMVHSTGADNPRLSRYVAPDDGQLGTPSKYHWNQPMDGNPKGVHAFVGKLADGGVAVYQTLPWTYEGWHCGGPANRTHIGFECCEDSIDPEDPACWLYFRSVYRQAALLTAHLCARYGLDPREPGVVLCHCEGHKRGLASNHADVLHWWPRFGRNMDDFRADVWTLMQGRQMAEVELPARLFPDREEEKRDMKREEVVRIAEEAVRAALARQREESEVRAVSGWAEQALETARTWGITDGTRPQSCATRQETAAMVVAGLEHMADKLPDLVRQELARAEVRQSGEDELQ